MPKNHASQRTPMEEKELQALENKLAELVDEGVLDVPVPEGLVKSVQREATSDRAKRLWASIQAGDLIRQRLKAARQGVILSGLSFSQVIEQLRTRAKLSVREVAQAVHMRPEDLTAVEEGKRNLLDIAMGTMANIIETFSLRLSIVEQSLKRSLAQQAIRSHMSAPSARTTGKLPVRAYEHAMDDIAGFLAEHGDEDGQVSLPEGYLSQLAMLLKRRGREDLV